MFTAEVQVVLNKTVKNTYGNTIANNINFDTLQHQATKSLLTLTGVIKYNLAHIDDPVYANTFIMSPSKITETHMFEILQHITVTR